MSLDSCVHAEIRRRWLGKYTAPNSSCSTKRTALVSCLVQRKAQPADCGRKASGLKLVLCIKTTGLEVDLHPRLAQCPCR